MKTDLLFPALTIIGGLGLLVFAALRFNRDDASAVVNQQSTLLQDMQRIIDELQGALERAREDRDKCAAEKKKLKSDKYAAEELLNAVTQEHLECSVEVNRLETKLKEAQSRLKKEQEKNGSA